MTPSILVVQQGPNSPGGIFTEELDRLGCALHLVRTCDGEALPTVEETLATHAGLVALGGPQHAWDDAAGPHFQALMHLMRALDEAGRPVAGVCLGCQVLARAHGGVGRTMDFLELGFTPLTLTPEGRRDPVLTAATRAAAMASPVGGTDAVLPWLMEFHQDTFSLPPRAELLVTGERCAAQCFRVGRMSHGFQFHLEATGDTARRWLTRFREETASSYARHRDEFDEAAHQRMLDDVDRHAPAAEAFCRAVAGAWLRQAVRS